MREQTKSEPVRQGQIGWIDLTVPDAVAVRDFHRSVTGWSPSPVDLGGYNDFRMTPTGAADSVAENWHARGPNAGLPRCGWFISPWSIWMKASPAASRSVARFSGRRNPWVPRPLLRDPRPGRRLSWAVRVERGSPKSRWWQAEPEHLPALMGRRFFLRLRQSYTTQAALTMNWVRSLIGPVAP
jgi:hypothetical protein